jgi:D-glycero-D-manno-heptose 1,7-bisphosphate phosphatase
MVTTSVVISWCAPNLVFRLSTLRQTRRRSTSLAMGTLGSFRPSSSVEYKPVCGGRYPERRSLLVLLDRDGVINVDVGSPGVCSVENFRLINGAGESVAKLKRAGASVCVVTNQTSVGKGMLSTSGLNNIHDRMRELLLYEGGNFAVVDDIFFATSATHLPCDRRKPAPGMLIEAMEAWNFCGEEKSSRITMIGDSVTDMQAAAAAGVPNRIMVGTGHGRKIWESISVTFGPGTKSVILSSPNEDPSRTLPPEIFPLTVCEDITAAVALTLRGVD